MSEIDEVEEEVHTRLLRSWWWFIDDESAVMQHATTGRRIRLRNIDSDSAGRLLTMLTEGMPQSLGLAEIADQVNMPTDVVASLLRSMEAAQVLVDTSSNEIPSDSERQRAFFGMVEQPGALAHECESRVRSASVCLVGLGGYGSWVVEFLARVGVGTMRLFDPDVVEEKNLSRQVLYTKGDVGEFKAEAALRRVNSIGRVDSVETSVVKVTDEQTILDAVSNSQLVISEWTWAVVCENSDQGRLGRLILNACIQSGVPLLSYTGSLIGPLTIPGVTACPACVATSASNFGVPTGMRAMSRFGAPSFAPRLGLVAAAVSWEAIFYLAGLPTESCSSVIHLDPFHWHSSVLPVSRNSDCIECSIPAKS